MWLVLRLVPSLGVLPLLSSLDASSHQRQEDHDRHGSGGDDQLEKHHADRCWQDEGNDRTGNRQEREQGHSYCHELELSGLPPQFVFHAFSFLGGSRRTVSRLLAARFAIPGCDFSGSSRVDDVDEQHRPLQHETLETDPVPHRHEAYFAPVREAEGHPKPQRVLPVGHDRELWRGVVGDERQGAGDVLVGVARAIFADDRLLGDALFDEPLSHQDSRGERLLFRRKIDAARHDDRIEPAALPERESADETLFGRGALQRIFRCHFAARDEQVAHGILLSSHEIVTLNNIRYLTNCQ